MRQAVGLVAEQVHRHSPEKRWHSPAGEAGVPGLPNHNRDMENGSLVIPDLISVTISFEIQ